MKQFNFKNLFEILHKPLKDNTNIKKEELYRDIFQEVYRLSGRPIDENDSTEPFRKMTSGIIPIQLYVAKKLHTEKGFELTRQCVEKYYLSYFEDYNGIIQKVAELFAHDDFIGDSVKKQILDSYKEKTDCFSASRFITAVLVCANYKNRYGSGADSQVFLNIQFMLLSEKEKRLKYPIFCTESPEDVTEFFTGRDKELEKLEEIVIAGGGSLLLSGVGGLGKTELVKSFIRKLMDTEIDECGVQYVAWVPYIHQSLEQSCKMALGFHDDAENAWIHIQDLAVRYRKKLLLVIDNVEKREDDNKLRKLADLPCRVLVTSRYREVSSLPSVCLEPLDKEACRNLFYHFYNLGRNDEYLDEIIDLAAKHTIMLEFLAKVAQLEEIKLGTLLERLIEKGFKLSVEDVSSTHEKLQTDDTIIKQMCVLFSLVNIEEKYQEILTYISVIPNLPFGFNKAKEWFGITKNSMLKQLYKMGMLENSKKDRKDVYWIHSVIAASVREQQKAVLYDKTRLFVGNLSAELDYGCEWGQGYKKAYLIPFSWSVADIMENRWEDKEDTDFLTRLYYVCFECGSYKLCEKLIMKILELDENNEDIEYQYLVRDYKNFGEILMKMERPKEAIEIFQKAEKLLRNEERNQAENTLILHKIGTAYQIKGDYPTAKTYYEKVIELDSQTDGVSERELSTDYSSLGCLLLDMGQYKEAYNNIKKAIELDGSREEDAETIMSYCYLASACSELSSEGYSEYYEEAQTCFQKVISFREKHLGKRHTDLADAYHEYSLFLYYNGELQDAMHYSQMACDINISVHSEYSVSAIRNRNTQGIILDAMGEHEKALEIYDEVLEICEELGDIPMDDFASFHFNKAESLKRIVKLDDAIRFYEESRDIWSRLFEGDSSKLSPVYQGIAECQMEKEEYEAAIISFLKALELNDRNIESTMEINDCLGQCYYLLGDVPNAEKRFMEVPRLMKQYGIYGTGIGILPYLNLASIAAGRGEKEKAEDFWQKAYKEAEALGDNELIEYVRECEIS